MEIKDYLWLIEVRDAFSKAQPNDTSKDIIEMTVELRDEIVLKLNEVLGKYAHYFVKK